MFVLRPLFIPTNIHAWFLLKWIFIFRGMKHLFRLTHRLRWRWIKRDGLQTTRVRLARWVLFWTGIRNVDTSLYLWDGSEFATHGDNGSCDTPTPLCVWMRLITLSLFLRRTYCRGKRSSIASYHTLSSCITLITSTVIHISEYTCVDERCRLYNGENGVHSTL